jgi:hypothetical protein
MFVLINFTNLVPLSVGSSLGILFDPEVGDDMFL